MSRWYGNRELSWLDFNGRVLALAKEPSVPLLERMKFLAIFSSNLDEFFQVRVAALKGQVAAGLSTASSDGLSPQRQLREIARYVDALVQEHERLLLDVLIPELRTHGVGIVRWDELTPSEQHEATTYFDRQLFPVLTPLAVDPAHPFPYVSNLAISLGVLVRNPLTMEQRFARVKVPSLIKRFFQVTEGRFVPVEDVIAAHIGELFEGRFFFCKEFTHASVCFY
jgi:polyphosphate kinase